MTIDSLPRPARGDRPAAADEVVLVEPEVAALARVHVDTVKSWRYAGTGPPFIRIGRRGIRYRRTDVLAWLAAGGVT